MSACENTDGEQPCSSGDAACAGSAASAAAYFFDGPALLPEYRSIGDNSPARRLFFYLTQGPADDSLVNAISRDFDLVSIGELNEGLLLEMNDAFWNSPPRTRMRAAAQIVFTMATFEDGKKVTFLKGALPEPIEVPGGRRLVRPVTRADYRAMRPWIEVAQPVAGATVGHQIPIKTRTRVPTALTVRLRVDEEGSVTHLKSSTGTVTVPADMTGPTTMLLITHQAGRRQIVEIPLTLAGAD